MTTLSEVVQDPLGDCLGDMARGGGAAQQAIVWKHSDTLLRHDVRGFVESVAVLLDHARGMSRYVMEHPLQMEIFSSANGTRCRTV